MSVRKTSRHGERVLVIDFSYRKPDGTKGRYRRDAEVQTLSAAHAEERRRLAALAATGSPFEVIDPIAREQVAPPAKTPTFADVVDHYKEAYLPTLKAATRYGYRVGIDGRLLPRFGKLPIDKVDATEVRTFEGELVRDELQTSSRRKVLTILRSVVCRFAVEAKYLPKAPELPKLPRKSKTVVLALSRAQVDALLLAAGPSARLAFALAAFAGLRASEVRALRWRDVDLERNEITVRVAQCRGVTDKPKSGDDRGIPIARALRALLLARGKRPAGELVAMTQQGKQWGEYGLRDAYRRIARRAAVEGFHFHCERHFFITELFEKGVGAPTVQALAGHANLETTARYAHVRQGSTRDAIDRLDGPVARPIEDDEPIAAE